MSVRRITVAAVALGVASAGALSAVTFDPAQSGAEAAAATAAAPRAERARSPRSPYRPRTGVLINDPNGGPKRKQLLNQHTIDIIRSTPGGQKIRMSSWNIDSPWFVNNAIDAHKRGVSVQILMSGGVAGRQNPRTGSFGRLKRAFSRYGNAQRKSHRKSFIKGCNASCRGPGGINHAKFLISSQTGRRAVARNIVTVSSANITAAAGANQWNDNFTVVGRPRVFNFFERLFWEMRPDRNRSQPYRQVRPGQPAWINKMWANPYRGRDPVLSALGPVRCKGARNAGFNGRTVIRIAQTAITGQRGRRIATRLKQLQRKGCRTKIIYTLMDREIRNQLNSGGAARVPTRQLARDRNRDGFYDVYLHTKVMTISGFYGNNRSMRFARVGSENWTEKAQRSDEVGFNINHRQFERRYSSWIDNMFRRANAGYVPKPPSGRTTGIDPFRYVEIN